MYGPRFPSSCLDFQYRSKRFLPGGETLVVAVEMAERIQKGTTIKATISHGSRLATRVDVQCSVELSDNYMRIRTADGVTDFASSVKSKPHFLSQLEQAYSELVKANRDPAYPSRREFCLEALGTPASFTVEQFCETSDPFELTLTVESAYADHRLWVSINEVELKKLLGNIV